MASGKGPEKAKSKSVSLLPTLWEQVETKASAEFNGNRSDYIRTLIEADLAGQASPTDVLAPTVLIDLAKRLLGERRAAILTRFLEGQDQPALLEHLLEDFYETTLTEASASNSGNAAPLALDSDLAQALRMALLAAPSSASPAQLGREIAVRAMEHAPARDYIRIAHTCVAHGKLIWDSLHGHDGAWRFLQSVLNQWNPSCPEYFALVSALAQHPFFAAETKRRLTAKVVDAALAATQTHSAVTEPIAPGELARAMRESAEQHAKDRGGREGPRKTGQG